MPLTAEEKALLDTFRTSLDVQITALVEARDDTRAIVRSAVEDNASSAEVRAMLAGIKDRIQLIGTNLTGLI